MTATKANLVRLSARSLTPPSLLGVWTNELGSTMDVTNVNGAYFSGVYASTDGHGGQVQGNLSGIAAGETLGWAVSWQPASDSTTSWVGKFMVDNTTGRICIYTLWYLSSGDASQPMWQSFTAGQDLFWQ